MADAASKPEQDELQRVGFAFGVSQEGGSERAQKGNPKNDKVCRMYPVLSLRYDTVPPARSEGMALIPLASYRITLHLLGLPCPEEYANTRPRKARYYHPSPTFQTPSSDLDRAKGISELR
jgi:hypothetical protein